MITSVLLWRKQHAAAVNALFFPKMPRFFVVVLFEEGFLKKSRKTTMIGGGNGQEKTARG